MLTSINICYILTIETIHKGGERVKIVKVQKGTNVLFISIPAEIKRDLDIKPKDELLIRRRGNEIVITQVVDVESEDNE